MTYGLLMTIGAVCVISVFISGILLALATKKHIEMLNVYRGILGLIRHSKLGGRKHK